MNTNTTVQLRRIWAHGMEPARYQARATASSTRTSRPSQTWRTVKMKKATTRMRTRGSRRASHDPRPR